MIGNGILPFAGSAGLPSGRLCSYGKLGGSPQLLPSSVKSVGASW